MENVKLTISQWAEEDRPREKMMAKGAASLSDAELLAILIGSGNREESAVELMKRVLQACGNNLNTLARWEMHDFSQFKGMGPAKSIAVMAALELGKRRNDQEQPDRVQVRESGDIYRLFHPLLRDLDREEFWVLLLNQAGRVIGRERLSSGGIDGTYVDVRFILRKALLAKATQLAIVHNHPSGNTRPSREDIQVTRKVSQAASTMNIRMIDHLVITDGAYYSFADEGQL